MDVLRDCSGLAIRLTDERLAHIHEHPEMRGLDAAIRRALSRPYRVIESLSDTRARLYYRHHARTRMGSKFLCVVVKVVGDDAFVLTAYLTDALKKGRQPWPATT